MTDKKDFLSILDKLKYISDEECDALFNRENPGFFSNGLRKDEDERLTVLAEECSEVIQAICKIKRHGKLSRFGNGDNNKEALEKELGHLLNALHMLYHFFDLNPDSVEKHREQKRLSCSMYLHYQNPTDPFFKK